MDGRAGTLLDEVSTGNPISDRKILMAIEGLPANTQKQLVNEFSPENRLILAEFLNNFVIHENITPGTKRTYVCNLLYLSRFLANKPFKQVTRNDILTYLQTLRRPLNSDPFQKWINTHNNRAVIYLKFFKWLNYPELSAKERMTPDVVKDLPILKRKEKTHIQAKDLWTPEDDAVFLKYVDDPRIQFYHTGSIDTSARPERLHRSGARLGRLLEARRVDLGEMLQDRFRNEAHRQGSLFDLLSIVGRFSGRDGLIERFDLNTEIEK